MDDIQRTEQSTEHNGPITKLGFSSTEARHGRTGELRLQAGTILTPCLFPVVCMMTGSTAVGGGLWKYILQAHTTHGLMRRNLPVMSQVLHFLDFSSLNSRALGNWRSSGLKHKYNEEVSPPLNYSAPIFLDSGGFKLLWSDNVDLSAYGLSLSGGKGAEVILELQRDLGGDIVATLDYPLPPGLAPPEAKERMSMSLANAMASAYYLQTHSDYNPFLHVAVHGQDRQSIGHYVRQVFAKFEVGGLIGYPFGLAVGSLVPLRGAKKYSAIIELLRGVKENIPGTRRDKVPIHVFGMTGNLVPLLAYMGIDTFDSSTYVQEARSLGYFDPVTHRSRAVLELEEWQCSCGVCRQVTLRELQESLTSVVHNRPLENGNYKSKYYGDIALHNLEMDFRIVEQTEQAIRGDYLQDFVISHVAKFPTLKPALEVLASEDATLGEKLNLFVSAPMPAKKPPIIAAPQISLKYNPNSFNILSNGYIPPEDKRILLIIPCSGEKPYSSSRTHRLIAERLKQSAGEHYDKIHIVTLSGLYGPVPREQETCPAVLGYDFRLDPRDKAQIDLLTERLTEYLNRFGDHYESCIGYATSLSYRCVLEEVSKRSSSLSVLPRKLKRRRLTEFFRRENISELMDETEIYIGGMQETPVPAKMTTVQKSAPHPLLP
ncbi:MAG TPA: tRNA-guanine transglycosylase [Chloroflexia bacterium]|jgi:tRNA-guanine family transglycosylase